MNYYEKQNKNVNETFVFFLKLANNVLSLESFNGSMYFTLERSETIHVKLNIELKTTNQSKQANLLLFFIHFARVNF